MTKTLSNMIELGTRAPNFSLLDTKTNRMVSLAQSKSDVATVIMFICNHCPYVKHIQIKLSEIAQIYQAKKVAFIAISSNDAIAYPADSPERMHEEAQLYHYPFPYLYDETQEVAKAYQAACTPDFYIFDKELQCVYRGRFDASTPGNGLPVTGEDLSKALDDVIAQRAVTVEQQPSIGCNIKWKKA